MRVNQIGWQPKIFCLEDFHIIIMFVFRTQLMVHILRHHLQYFVVKKHPRSWSKTIHYYILNSTRLASFLCLSEPLKPTGSLHLLLSPLSMFLIIISKPLRLLYVFPDFFTTTLESLILYFDSSLVTFLDF